MRRKNIWPLITAVSLSLFLFSNYGVMAADPKPGTVIGPDNWKQYEEYLTPVLIEQIKVGFSFPVLDVDPKLIKPASGYIKATEKNRGVVKIGPKEELINWKGGLPFPDIDPKDHQAGLQVAYNIERRFKGDDQILEKYQLIMVDPHGKERLVGGLDKSWSLSWITGRTDVPPIPEWLPNPEGVRYLNNLTMDYPYDLKGVMRYLIRYEDLTKDDDIWMYIPTMRRVRRMSGAQREDIFGGTDSTYDDIRGFDGRPVEYNWKLIGEKKILVAAQCQHSPHPRTKGTYWGSLWKEGRAVRDCWIIEGIPKKKGYIYSKRVLWVDKVIGIPWHFMVYDPQGRLWKVGEEYTTPYRTGPKADGEFVFVDDCYTWIDLLAKRFTLYEWVGWDEKGNQTARINTGLTKDMFGVDILTERGRR